VVEQRVSLREGARVLGRGIRAEPWVFTLSLVGSVLFGLVTVLSARAVGWVTDEVIQPAFATGATTAAALAGAAGLLVGLGVLRALSILLRRLFAGIMQYRLQARDRRRVSRQYLRLPLSWHHRHPTGELLSNASSDVEATWAPVAPMPMAFGVLVTLVFALVSMLLADPLLAAVGMFVFPLVMVVNVVYQRRMAPLAAQAQALRAEVATIAHESFDGALVVKSLGREAEETARFGDAADRLRAVNTKAGRLRGTFDPLIEALPTLGVLAVLLLGTRQVAAGVQEPGTVVEVAYLLTVVSFPVRAIGWLLGEMPRSVVGARRVERVLAATGAMPSGQDVLSGDGPLAARAEALGYSYQPGFPVLTDVDLDVSPGRVLAVVGATGGGKSTLVSLLVRLVDPEHGRIRLDGVDARDLAAGQVPAAGAVVLQQAFLFDDTVRGNVTLGEPVDDERVWEALRLAQVEDVVAALPEGLDAQIGERGTALSGGQRQRVALARALVRRPRLLVLDDATSAVDPDVEHRILDGLRAAAGGTTVVVVAHRPATIALADEVAFLAGGAVVDHGTHAELLARNDAYRDLVTAYEQERALVDAASSHQPGAGQVGR
jgi:ABC-type multidrug transport system fused ATPase/permease subunit